MNISRKISGYTMLSALLTQYPYLKHRLPEINEKFRLLHTPLSFLMLRKATISEMSRQSGTPEDELIFGIERIIAEGA